jgi:hypothetical protein
MSEESEKKSLMVPENAETQLQKFEGTLISTLENLSLPSTGIFVDIPERATVFINIIKRILIYFSF